MFGRKTNIPKKFLQEYEAWLGAIEALPRNEDPGIAGEIAKLCVAGTDVRRCLEDQKMNRTYAFTVLYQCRDALSAGARSALGPLTEYLDVIEVPDQRERAEILAAIASARTLEDTISREILPLADRWLAENRAQVSHCFGAPDDFDPDLVVFDMGEIEKLGPVAPAQIVEAVDRMMSGAARDQDLALVSAFFERVGMSARGILARIRAMAGYKGKGWNGRLPLITAEFGERFAKRPYPRLALSPKLNQIALRDYSGDGADNWEVLPYSAIMEARLIVDEKTIAETISSTNSAGVAIGNVVFSSGTAHSTSVVGKYVKKITIQIRLATSDRPIRNVVIASYRELQPIEGVWHSLQKAETWIARLKNIIELEAEQVNPTLQVLSVPPSSESVALQAWRNIERSLDPNDYADFLEAFRGTQEALLAARHKRQLEAWAAMDRSDRGRVADFLASGLFPALNDVVYQSVRD